jgi:hypothetical protein
MSQVNPPIKTLTFFAGTPFMPMLPTTQAQSTKHNNEQLVKLSALMVSTGKSEIMASIFAIASNDCMQEYTDKEETHQEPAN